MLRKSAGSICLRFSSHDDPNRAYPSKLHLRTEIFASVIQWHCLRRVVRRAANQNPMIAGGDHTIIQRIVSARLFPQRGNNVGAKRRQCNTKHLQMQFGGTMSEHGIFATSEPRFGQIGSAQKFATVAGGYYLPLRGLCHRISAGVISERP